MDQLRALMDRVDGPGFRWDYDRDQAVAELRALGPALHPALAECLRHPDPAERCLAGSTAAFAAQNGWLELVLALLGDPDDTVRWHGCGLLHDFRDERAVPELARVMRSDPDPQVRGTAAYALGGIGSPAAIPDLLAVLGVDNEYDIHGHSTSSCAATALDDILGTHETRIRVGEGLCRMAEWPPDLDRLRRLASELFQRWSSADAAPGTVSDENA